ncbi:hypothetical protein HanRHA438_Chr16g0752001 [Helianthus annuus]|nr:hypothetical protein HanRHA438_Chr16g0752001 [Helianthus annuus]
MLMEFVVEIQRLASNCGDSRVHSSRLGAADVVPHELVTLAAQRGSSLALWLLFLRENM